MVFAHKDNSEWLMGFWDYAPPYVPLYNLKQYLDSPFNTTGYNICSTL